MAKNVAPFMKLSSIKRNLDSIITARMTEQSYLALRKQFGCKKLNKAQFDILPSFLSNENQVDVFAYVNDVNDESQDLLHVIPAVEQVVKRNVIHRRNLLSSLIITRDSSRTKALAKAASKMSKHANLVRIQRLDEETIDHLPQQFDNGYIIGDIVIATPEHLLQWISRDWTAGEQVSRLRFVSVDKIDDMFSVEHTTTPDNHKNEPKHIEDLNKNKKSTNKIVSVKSANNSISIIERVFKCLPNLDKSTQMLISSKSVDADLMDFSTMNLRKGYRMIDTTSMSVDKDVMMEKVRKVEQELLCVPSDSFLQSMYTILRSWRRVPNHRVLIHCQTLSQVQYLAKMLEYTGTGSLALHDSLPYGEKRKLIYTFTQTDNCILIATDDSLRYLDTFESNKINFVLQYGLPISRSSYIERVYRLALTCPTITSKRGLLLVNSFESKEAETLVENLNVVTMPPLKIGSVASREIGMATIQMNAASNGILPLLYQYQLGFYHSISTQTGWSTIQTINRCREIANGTQLKSYLNKSQIENNLFGLDINGGDISELLPYNPDVVHPEDRNGATSYGNHKDVLPRSRSPVAIRLHKPPTMRPDYMLRRRIPLDKLTRLHSPRLKLKNNLNMQAKASKDELERLDYVRRKAKFDAAEAKRIEREDRTLRNLQRKRMKIRRIEIEGFQSTDLSAKFIDSQRRHERMLRRRKPIVSDKQL